MWTRLPQSSAVLLSRHPSSIVGRIIIVTGTNSCTRYTIDLFSMRQMSVLH